MMDWNPIGAMVPQLVLAHCWEGHEHTGLTLVQWLLLGGGAAVLAGLLAALLVCRARWRQRKTHQAEAAGADGQGPDAN